MKVEEMRVFDATCPKCNLRNVETYLMYGICENCKLPLLIKLSKGHVVPQQKCSYCGVIFKNLDRYSGEIEKDAQ